MEKLKLGAPESSGCSGRREFLRDAGLAAAALLMGLGATRREAEALPVRELNGARNASEVRYPLPTSDGTTIDRANEIILTRWKGTIYAFALSCPHQHTALRWQADQGRFECPKHHSKYQPDGAFISGRATRSMDRHPVRLDGAAVVVDAATVLRQDQDAAGWGRALAVVA